MAKGNSSDKPVAVALAYEHGQGHAPRVVAKGKGVVAEQIVATAAENDVAVEQNPVLASALSEVDLDTEIPVELYRAVAEVIGYVMRVGARR